MLKIFGAALCVAGIVLGLAGGCASTCHGASPAWRCELHSWWTHEPDDSLHFATILTNASKATQRITLVQHCGIEYRALPETLERHRAYQDSLAAIMASREDRYLRCYGEERLPLYISLAPSLFPLLPFEGCPIELAAGDSLRFDGAVGVYLPKLERWPGHLVLTSRIWSGTWGRPFKEAALIGQAELEIPVGGRGAED